MNIAGSVRTCFVLGALLASVGCSAFAVPSQNMESANSYGPLRRTYGLPAGSYIKHIVIIVQENRSFDNIFAGFPGADAPTFGYTHTGSTVPLRPTNFNGVDLSHYYKSAINEWDNGKMDGFDQSTLATGGPSGLIPYAFLQRSLVKPYWTMAHQYVLADRMYPTEFGSSFTAHLDLIAGTTKLSSTLAEVDTPDVTQNWGCDAPAGTTTSTLSSVGVINSNGPFPCFNQFQTMAGALDSTNVSWKYYAPAVGGSGYIWSAFDAIQGVREGPDWKTNVISPETTVLGDAASGNLPAVSWVIPDNGFSDHPGSDSDSGPSWVAAVVNAIGTSKSWNSTAIVVLWDDWGGWYDDSPPPQLDYLGLAIRVPCIIISPYARAHTVSHTQYEFGSVLKFVEQTFSVPSLGYSDARANSLIDSFDFTQPPRTFIPIPAPYPPSYFANHKPSLKPPDDD